MSSGCFDQEINLIKAFQDESTKKICLCNSCPEAEKVLNQIHDPKQWSLWTDSSAHDAPPPDFFCNQFSLMMEVMRVNDTERKGRKSRYNPVLQAERDFRREISEVLGPAAGQNAHIICGTKNGEKDHCFEWYLQNFQRVIRTHIQNIDEYKRNHPNCAVIFFIYDESTAYGEDLKNKFQIRCSQIHIPVQDENFLRALKDVSPKGNGIDYVIWYMPNKFYGNITGVENGIAFHAPRAFVLNMTNIGKTRNYSVKKMDSFELEEGHIDDSAFIPMDTIPYNVLNNNSRKRIIIK